MGARRVVTSELQLSLGECLGELEYGTTLLMTDQGRQVPRTPLSHGLARMTVAILVACVVPFSTRLQAQQDPLHPPPFLEATDLVPGVPGRDRDVPEDVAVLGSVLSDTPERRNLLEADIFPHFVLGFASRCRRSNSSWYALVPCISVTPAIRLRMLNAVSVPIESPSYMPRLNIQWPVYYGDDDDDTFSVTFQAGHHSNGQGDNNCLFKSADGPEAGGCIDESVQSDGLPELFKAEPDGNFSLNYLKFTVDFATYRFFRGQGSGLTLGYEHSDKEWMHAPMRGLYPSRRFHLALRHAVFTPFPACGRLYISFRGVISLKNGDDDRFQEPSQSYQATCLWSEERGIGAFARLEHGRDDYNSSFFSNPASTRFKVGLTINRLRTFGADY